MPSSPETGSLPLAGVSVVDLSRMLPGQTCTQLLADLGADVVKVERPGTGDESRALTPRVGGSSSVQHQYLDRGKSSVRLDLKDPADVAVVRELVRSADAVVESFRPGVADRLGLGFDDLTAVNPRLVYLSLTGFGATGARSLAAGHDLTYAALAGLLGGAPAPDGRPGPVPTAPGAQVADTAGGMLAAVGVLAGVLRARTTGSPARVEVALAEAALYVNGFALAGALGAAALGQQVEPVLDGSLARYRTYACADGRHLAVGALEPRFWTTVTDLLGRPDLLSLPEPEATAELAALLATRPAAHWVELLSGDDTCVALVQHPDEVGADEGFRARGAVVDVPTAAGPLPQVGQPVRIAGAPTRYAPPRDLDPAEVAELGRRAGARS